MAISFEGKVCVITGAGNGLGKSHALALASRGAKVVVLALPANLPEFIEVDMSDLQVGDIIHLSDLKLPEGVTSTSLALGDDRDMGVASVLAPRGTKGSGGSEDGDDEPSEGSTSEDGSAES